MVVGCGRVGSALSSRLVDDGHSVAVVDKRASAFTRLPKGFPGSTVTGFGFDRDRLVEAGIESADALAAVTSGDNSNIMVARIARETYAVGRVMARIYDPKRAMIYERLGIPTVATVEWTTDQALRRLLPSETRTEWVDPTGGVVVVERSLAATWAGRPLTDLDAPGRWRVTVLTRIGRATVPAPGLVVQEGDVVLVAVASEALADFNQALDATPIGRH